MGPLPYWDEALLAWLAPVAKDHTLADGERPRPFALYDPQMLWEAAAMLWVLGHRGWTPPLLVDLLNTLMPPSDPVGQGLLHLAHAWQRLVARHPSPPDWEEWASSLC